MPTIQTWERQCLASQLRSEARRFSPHPIPHGKDVLLTILGAFAFMGTLLFVLAVWP